VSDLHTYYGNIQALKGIDLHVEEGKIVTILGANGAGKTTLMKTIIGLIKPKQGKVEFLGQDITISRPDQLIKKGMALVPEGRAMLSDMTVLDNLEMGAYHRSDHDVQKDIEQMMAHFPILEERKEQLAGTMSGGQQQMLAIARALMARPKLLLLDEPSMGLAPIIVADIFKMIKEINQDGTTILLVEQNAKQALKIADYGYVLETGKLALEGQADELLENKSIAEAYLGG
jgi:branched-chain amino acid transport system ATP-binding protein